MKYYKLVLDNQIIGAISSRNFIRFSPRTNSYLRCDENLGEYISYEGQLYRATWMCPIVMQEEYTEVQAISITEQEYEIYAHAIENNEEIIDHSDDPIIEPPVDPVEENSLEFIKASKINEMSYVCRQTIENGFNLEIRNEIRHFSLTTQDQLNLMNLSILAQTQSLIPYHADGEECTFYTSEEINMLMQAANELIIYNTTYYNGLKTYINSLETIEEVGAIVYGTPIPDQYKSDVLQVLGY